jgi:hypothetical protein
MYIELDAIIAEIKNRLSAEKSLKNKILLEKAIDALSDYQRQAALRH